MSRKTDSLLISSIILTHTVLVITSIQSFSKCPLQFPYFILIQITKILTYKTNYKQTYNRLTSVLNVNISEKEIIFSTS